MEDQSGRKFEGATAAAPRCTFHYGQADLKRIGEQCANRLPPANTVQAMFLYEMQRATEVESLFQAQMFDLARAEDIAAAQARRIEDLEVRITRMEKQAASRNVEERLATSKVALNVQQGKLNTCSVRVDHLEEKLGGLVPQLQALRTAQERAAKTAAPSTQNDELIATMKAELDVLFDDRDGILQIVREADDRVHKLEDNVRALTKQGTALQTPRSSSPQVLPLQTSNGTAVDLAVRKGNPHVPFKSASPSIRTFGSGQQWGS